MAFTDLSLELQNIYLTEFSNISKWFLFLIFIFLSSTYLFYIWPNHKKTTLWTVAIYRLFFWGCSAVYLIGTPILFINLSPELSIFDFYNIFLRIYYVGISLAFIIFSIDIIRVGLIGTLIRAGLDINDPSVNEIVRRTQNNKHWLK